MRRMHAHGHTRQTNMTKPQASPQVRHATAPLLFPARRVLYMGALRAELCQVAFLLHMNAHFGPQTILHVSVHSLWGLLARPLSRSVSGIFVVLIIWRSLPWIFLDGGFFSALFLRTLRPLTAFKNAPIETCPNFVQTIVFFVFFSGFQFEIMKKLSGNCRLSSFRQIFDKFGSP